LRLAVLEVCSGKIFGAHMPWPTEICLVTSEWLTELCCAVLRLAACSVYLCPQDAFGPAAAAPELQLPPALAAAVQRQWLTTTRRSPLSKRGSGFAGDVSRVLRDQLGLRVGAEKRTSDGLFSMDLLTTWNGT
jgi:hypothetical protein